MELADQITVINRGRVEQIGVPRELYDHPANAFVMSFVGPVTRVGETLVRPGDVHISADANGSAEEAMVDRVVHLGFEVRAELVRHDGEHLWAQLSSAEAEQLELERGQIVYVQATRGRVFASGDPS